MTIEILMVIGFCLAAYSIVGNDVPQTLGTGGVSKSMLALNESIIDIKEH